MGNRSWRSNSLLCGCEDQAVREPDSTHWALSSSRRASTSTSASGPGRTKAVAIVQASIRAASKRDICRVGLRAAHRCGSLSVTYGLRPICLGSRPVLRSLISLACLEVGREDVKYQGGRSVGQRQVRACAVTKAANSS